MLIPSELQAKIQNSMIQFLYYERGHFVCSLGNYDIITGRQSSEGAPLGLFVLSKFFDGTPYLQYESVF